MVESREGGAVPALFKTRSCDLMPVVTGIDATVYNSQTLMGKLGKI